MNETYIQTIRGGISHHTVAKVFVGVDGFEYRAF